LGSQAVTEIIKFLNLLKRLHVDKNLLPLAIFSTEKIGKFLEFFCIVNLTKLRGVLVFTFGPMTQTRVIE
jgi:hypothetical protein